MTSIRETKFVHDGTNLTVRETVTPAEFDYVMQHDATVKNYAQNMAKDLYKFGSGKFSIEGQRVTPCDYRLEVNIDLSKNQRVVRDANAMSIFNRIGAMFGATVQPAQAAAQAAGVNGIMERESFKYDSPPVSLLGDVFRLAGHAAGMVMDYIMWVLWSFFDGAKAMFSAPERQQ